MLRPSWLKRRSRSSNGRSLVRARRLTVEGVEERRMLSASVVGTFSPLDGGTLDCRTTSLFVDFSEAVVGAGDADNYQLQGFGEDRLLGTADDSMVPLSADYIDGSAMLSFPGLGEGIYRLTVYDTITDTGGGALDGDGDGTSGGDAVLEFVVVAPGNEAFFGAAIAYAEGEGARYSCTGDFNGDGHLDLVIADLHAENWPLEIRLGNGDGTFEEPLTVVNDLWEAVPIPGDFDGDGRLDLVLMTDVLFGNGDGTFAAPVPFGSEYLGGSFVADDFNSDGRCDLAATMLEGSGFRIQLYWGQGEGALADGGVLSTVYEHYPSLAAGDFDNDGVPDVLVTAVGGSGPCAMDLFRSGGDGTFAPPVTTWTAESYPEMSTLVTGDYNGDGSLDVAVLDLAIRLGVYTGCGDGTFSRLVTEISDARLAAAADVNGDGATDLVVDRVSADRDTRLLLAAGDGTFVDAGAIGEWETGSFNQVVPGDFDGDGRVDVAVIAVEWIDEGLLQGWLYVYCNDYAPGPVVLDSAGGLPFEVQVAGGMAGQLLQGPADAFDGLNRLQVDGEDFTGPFAPAVMADGGQTVMLAEQSLAGLCVHREVTVPLSGSEDFARVVDVFSNLTSDAITATVRIVGNLGSDAATVVWSTSSGDTAVEAADQWIGTDDADGSGSPAIIHYVHGPAGLQPTMVRLTGDRGDNIEWTYELSVPAGETVRLAHFTILAATRAEAEAAAGVLVTPGGFGGEAAARLTARERDSIANFDYPPADPIPPSVVSSAPSLTGGTLASQATQLSIQFSEPVIGAGNAANYRLQGLGPDGLLGTSDDTQVPFSVAYAGGTATLSFPSLPESVYRLTVRDAIVDTADNPLDGDGDGEGGGDRMFEFVALTPANDTFFNSARAWSCGGAEPLSIVAGDLNGDAVPDLVATLDVPEGGVGTLLGRGDGTFADITITAGDHLIAAVAGDFNDDGCSDLVTSSYDSTTVQLLVSCGDGTFTEGPILNTAVLVGRAVTLAAGDFDGDDRLDLAMGTDMGEIGLALGRGDGTFAVVSPISNRGVSILNSLLGADFNADGNLDLAVADPWDQAVGLLMGRGDGTFTNPGDVPCIEFPRSLAVADFDFDGHMDLAISGLAGSIGVSFGRGDGTFTEMQLNSGDVEAISVAADFNGDGYADLLEPADWSGTETTAKLFLGNGDGTFADGISLSCGGVSPVGLTATDLNGDGRLDLAAANATSGDVGVLLGHGTLFGATISPQLTARPMWIAPRDFNADGQLDLATVGFQPNSEFGVGVLLGDGDGTFQDTTVVAADLWFGPPVAGDFNGDGDADLAVPSQVFFGHGDGTFDDAEPIAAIDWSGEMTAADFNGDGLTDLAANVLVAPASSQQTIAVLLGCSDGTFTDAGRLNVALLDTARLTTGDVNGDGLVDVLAYAADRYAVTLHVFASHGDGTFANPTTTDLGGDSGVTAIFTGDYSGDGVADAVLVSNYLSWVRLYPGLGDGTFAPCDQMYPEIRQATAGDFNADGLLDVVLARQLSSTECSIELLLAAGDGTLQSAGISRADYLPSSLVAGDFDGDHRLDLALAGADAWRGQVWVLQNGYAPQPEVLNSAHGLPFDIQFAGSTAGQLLQGSGGAFDGPNRLQIAGEDFRGPFAPAVLDDAGRTVRLRTQSMAGLSVYREITVPDAGEEDFARTVDVFTNPTSSPITTTVRIVGNLGSDDATTVFATSDGDTVVEATDQWIGTDDALDGSGGVVATAAGAAGTPAIIHYLHGPRGLKPTMVRLAGDRGDNIEWTYQITVAPGETVRLAHYTILAASRAQATAAANALVAATGFGGQAAAFLSADELASIANFAFAAPNTPPVAANDSYTVAEDGALSITGPGVLGNDTDPDLDALSAVWVAGPSHGTLVLNADGSFTYQPTADYFGPDSFTYRATDASDSSAVATVSITVTPTTDITGRYLFYNNSAFDGNSAAINAQDYDAIAPAPSVWGHGHADSSNETDKQLGKQALLPGQTATFANYSSFAKGINGIMIAVDDLADPAALTLADFVFRVGNSNSPESFTAAPAPLAFHVDLDVVHPSLPGHPDVVTIVWAEDNPYTALREPGSISNQWLQVTVLAGEHTGLANADVFYWGSQLCESGNSASDTNVDQNDEIGARNHPHTAFTPATAADPYDFNRDGKVDQNDEILARNNTVTAFTRIALISPPAVSSSTASARGIVVTKQAQAAVQAQAKHPASKADPDMPAVEFDDTAEFVAPADASSSASAGSASAQADVLAAVVHEMGSVLRRKDLDAAADDLLSSHLASGLRRGPCLFSADSYDAVFAGDAASD